MNLQYLFRRCKTFKRSIRFYYQRLTRGWSDQETWSLDVSLAKLILPRLKRFREVSIVIPFNMTEQQWNDLLDKMIYAFDIMASSDYFSAFTDENNERCQEGLNLFAQYYRFLWW